MDETILARADALMQRRRPAAPDGDDLPVLTRVAPYGEDAAAIGDEDLPVLTAAIASPVPATPMVAALPAATLASDGLEALAGELAGRIERRIAAELPRIIDEAIRDALAERGPGYPSPPRR